MKKILLFFGTFFLFINGFAQTSVMITGELNPSPNQTYTYRINKFIGISGTNATWKVTNGKFINGSTTLVQDVDNTSVGVIWTKTGQAGTISYSYKNGSSAGYTGFTSVNIKGGGAYEGVYDWKLDNYGVTEMSPGSTQMFSYHVPDVNLYVKWIYDTNCFEYVANDAHDHRSITLRAKGTMKSQNTKIEVKVLGVTKSLNISVLPVDLDVIRSDKYLCDIQTTTFTIKNIEYLSGTSSISWQSTPTMTLVSGQGAATATYRVLGNDHGTVNAVITYEGKNYIYKGYIPVGPPPKPILVGLPQGDYKPNTGYLLSVDCLGGGYPESIDAYVVGGTTTLIPQGSDFTMILKNGSVPPRESSSFSLYVTAKNRCGTSPQLIINGKVVGGDYTDPGHDNGIIATSAPTPSPVSVKVYNFNSGTLVYSEKNVIDFNIQNTTLKDGIYIVVTTDQKGEAKSEKVVKTRN